jgi:sugar/nucleoside kinase (ribokinase family)
MKNFNLSIYGNIILDNVYYISDFRNGTSNIIEKKYTSVGSIGNMLAPLGKDITIQILSKVSNDYEGNKILSLLSENISEKTSIDVQISSNNKTSNALIVSDIFKNTRTSMVEWGICRTIDNIEAIKGDWVHFMYLDTLDNLGCTSLSKMDKNKIISADLCLGKHSQEQTEKIMNMLEYIDYLILSDVEAKSLTSGQKNGIWRSYCMEEAAKIISKKVKKMVIIHSPHGSITCDKDGIIQTYSSEFISSKRMNVLGAGDLFASSFIKKMIESHDVDKSIKYAHKNTTLILKQRD